LLSRRMLRAPYYSPVAPDGTVCCTYAKEPVAASHEVCHLAPPHGNYLACPVARRSTPDAQILVHGVPKALRAPLPAAGASVLLPI